MEQVVFLRALPSASAQVAPPLYHNVCRASCRASSPSGRWIFLDLNSSELPNPILASRYLKPVPRQPNPYLILRLRLIEDASGKYFVGQLTSPIVNPCQRI